MAGGNKGAKAPPTATKDSAKGDDARSQIRARDEDADTLDDAAADSTTTSELPPLKTAAAAAAEEAAAEPPKLRTDAARDEIVAKSKARRKAGQQDDTDDEIDAAEEAAADAEVDAATESKDAPREKKKPAVVAADDDAGDDADADLDNDRLITRRINGREVTLTLDEWLNRGSKVAAADDYLEQARNTLKTVRQPAGSDQDDTETDRRNQPDRTTESEPGRNGQRRATKLDPAQLVDSVDKIQAGTPEEGAEALAEAIQRGIEAALQAQPDVRSEIEAARREDAGRAEVNRALDTVVTTYPEVNADSRLAMLAVDGGFSGLRQNLLDAGYPEDVIAPLTQGDLLRNYIEVRRDPRLSSKLPDVQTVFSTAAKTIHDDFVAPRFANRRGADGDVEADDTPESDRKPPGRIVISPERAARRSDAQSQPRSASTRADHTVAPQGTRDERRHAAIDKSRAARGQIAIR